MKAGAFRERELTIPADLCMLRDARDWAARVAADFGFREDERFQVRLATSEAVTNAIVHGSASDADAVELGAHEEHGALVFEVRDAGANEVPPGPLERLAEGGRGLELVGLIMDEVELERGTGGSVLRFTKRLAA
jgi:anti-sigma regulatory factor (Ser/Thr protein kinase)